MGFMTHSKRIFLLLGFIAAFSACTKKNETSTLSMQFGDWNELRAKDIAYRSKVSTLSAPDSAKLNLLVVNATGARTPYRWDRHDFSDSVNATPPTSVELSEVKQGKGIVVQVVAIYETSAGMEFYYGSSTIEINSATPPPVDIVITNLVTGAITEGDFVGQFIPTTGAPPTGPIDYMFNPPDGGPQVLVHRSEMFRGWARLTAFSTNLLSHASPNPVINSMLSQLRILNDGFFSMSDPGRAMRVRVPAHSANESHTVGGWDMKDRGQRVLNVGFFGPGAEAQGKKVCFDGTNQLIDKLYLTSAHNAGDQLEWYGKTVPPSSPLKYAYVEEVATAAPVTFSLFKGGVTLVENPSCATEVASTNEEYVHYMKFNPTQLAHSDSVVAFKGAFRPVEYSSGYPTYVKLVDAGGAAYTVTWRLLPGLTDGDFGGATLFYREVTSGNAWDDNSLRKGDGYACNSFASGNFSPAFNSQTVTPTAASATINGITDGSKLQVVVCLKDLNGQYHNSAAMGAGSGGGGGGRYDLKMVYVPDPSQTVFSTSTCKEHKFEIRFNGALHNVTQNVTVNYVSQNGNLLYTEATCNGGGAGAAGGAVTIASGTSSSQSFWIRQTTPGTANFVGSSSTAGYTSASLNDAAISFYSTSPAFSGVKINSSNAMAVGQCYPMRVSLLYGSGLGGSSTPVNFDLMTNILSGNFHLAPDCTDAAIPITGSAEFVMPAYAHTYQLYFKPTAPSTGDMIATATISGYNYAFNATAGPNTHTGYRVKVEGPVQNFDSSNLCLPIRIEPVNSAGAAVSVASARSVTVTMVNGGTMHTDSVCSSGAISSKTMNFVASERSSTDLVYGLFNTGAEAFRMNINDPVLSPFNFTGALTQIEPKHPAGYRIINADGSPLTPTIMRSFCYPIRVEAVDQWNNPVSVNGFQTIDLGQVGNAMAYSTVSNCSSSSSNGTATFNFGQTQSNIVYINPTVLGGGGCSMSVQRVGTYSQGPMLTHACATADINRIDTLVSSGQIQVATLYNSSYQIPPHPVSVTVTLTGGTCAFSSGPPTLQTYIISGVSYALSPVVTGSGCTIGVSLGAGSPVPTGAFTFTGTTSM